MKRRIHPFRELRRDTKTPSRRRAFHFIAVRVSGLLVRYVRQFFRRDQLAVQRVARMK